MQLNIFERLQIKNIVSQIEGLADANTEVEGLFTEQEKADLQIEQDGTQVKWRVKRDDGTDIPQERDIQISDNLKNDIGSFLQQRFGYISLYNKFVR